MLDIATMRRIVRASAIYDLVVIAPFLTPWTFAFAHGQLQAQNAMLGGAPLPPFAPLHILFVCALASLVTIWSVLRIADPQIRFGRYDGTGRVLFAVWMAWALAMSDTPILWLFIVPELAWGIAQWLPVAARPERRGRAARCYARC